MSTPSNLDILSSSRSVQNTRTKGSTLIIPYIILGVVDLFLVAVLLSESHLPDVADQLLHSHLTSALRVTLLEEKGKDGFFVMRLRGTSTRVGTRRSSIAVK